MSPNLYPLFLAIYCRRVLGEPVSLSSHLVSCMDSERGLGRRNRREEWDGDIEEDEGLTSRKETLNPKH